ncbi:MAG: hypothetical protein OES24_06475 [Acidimicrobiia bacterium]|nr:hypothetical protein [Acidimicrobiia bacterium]
MSIRVDIADLPRHLMSRGGGFLLTSILDSRPHVAHLPFEVAAADGQVQLRARVGRTSYGNCGQQPSVTVLWPAVDAPPAAPGWPADQGPDGSDADLDRFSLIVDGEARLDGPEHVVIAVTGAVFHRPVPTAPSP